MKKNSRGSLQGGQLVPPWITWVSVKCQLSGLLWKAGAEAFPRDNIQYQMSPDIDQDLGATASLSLLPLHLSTSYPLPSLFTIMGSPLGLTGAPHLLSLAHPVTRQSAMNTETCYLNVIKCKYLVIFLMPRERAHVDMHITNKRPSWTTAEKSRQALRAGRLANTNQFHCVFVFGVSRSGMKPPLRAAAAVWPAQSCQRVTLAYISKQENAKTPLNISTEYGYKNKNRIMKALFHKCQTAVKV